MRAVRWCDMCCVQRVSSLCTKLHKTSLHLSTHIHKRSAEGLVNRDKIQICLVTGLREGFAFKRGKESTTLETLFRMCMLWPRTVFVNKRRETRFGLYQFQDSCTHDTSKPRDVEEAQVYGHIQGTCSTLRVLSMCPVCLGSAVIWNTLMLRTQNMQLQPASPLKYHEYWICWRLYRQSDKWVLPDSECERHFYHVWKQFSFFFVCFAGCRNGWTRSSFWLYSQLRM